MEEIEIKTWDEFPRVIEEIRKRYAAAKAGEYTLKNDIIFRGQADFAWALQTTLERSSSRSWTVAEYAALTLRCAPQISSVTEEFSDLPGYQEAESEILDGFDESNAYVPPAIYKFWIYLRHHGFPSPLLDWTLSPYIAAFFSFAELRDAEKAAVFAYIEHPMGTKAGRTSDAKIKTMNPFVTTHKRHFIQQCFYTIATKPEAEEHRFVCHEGIFDRGSQRQDVLIKIAMPLSERMVVLKYLNDVNINYFSLFQSEDSLVRSLALKEFELDL